MLGKSVTVSQLLKSGLTVAVTTDEPTPISLSLTAPAPASKSKKKKSKSKKAKAKGQKLALVKPKKPKAPVVLSSATGATKVAGGTAVITLKLSKKSRKTLTALKKGTKLTLTTSIKDAAGNSSSAASTIKLAKG